MTQPRFVILPVEVAGYATRLRQGLESIGHEADFWCLGENPFGYEIPPPRGRLAKWMIGIAGAGAGAGALRRSLMRLANLPIKAAAAVVTYRRGTVLVCMSGRSLLGTWDRRFARWRGATVVSVYLGSDSRPPYLNGVYMNTDREPDWAQVHQSVEHLACQVRRSEMLSDYVVCSPASAQFLSRPFVNWFRVGMPIDGPTGETPRYGAEASSSGTVRVLHAPSRPRQKGSEEFRSAIGALQAQGIDLEYVELRNAQNAEVRRQIQRSDVVLDELYSDTFLGGIGVEAAMAGVPVLTFGYARGLFDQVVGDTAYPREGYADPLDLMSVLHRAVTDADWRSQLARRQFELVRTEWTARAVAARYVEIADRGADPDWLVDPQCVSYMWGFGMPQELLRSRLATYVDLFGWQGLELAPGGTALRRAQQIAKGG